MPRKSKETQQRQQKARSKYAKMAKRKKKLEEYDSEDEPSQIIIENEPDTEPEVSSSEEETPPPTPKPKRKRKKKRSKKRVIEYSDEEESDNQEDVRMKQLEELLNNKLSLFEQQLNNLNKPKHTEKVVEKVKEPTNMDHSEQGSRSGSALRINSLSRLSNRRFDQTNRRFDQTNANVHVQLVKPKEQKRYLKF